ncbi:hypothetical protein BJX70DRAFT_395302 [Aspergillus crustosus]
MLILRYRQCDEKGHPCGNCAFRQTECTYPSSSNSTTNSSPEGSEQSRSERQTSPATGILLDSSNKLLLQLMHRYSTETYKTFFSQAADYHVWQTLVPQWAFEYDFLLYGILSVSALHIANDLEPFKAQQLLDASSEFQSQALKPFQEALQNLTPENCDAVFAHFRVTVVHGIAFSQIANASNETNMLEHIFVIFELLQGTVAINEVSRECLKNSALIPRDFWRSPD